MKREQHHPAKKKELSKLAQASAMVSPLKPGLTLVVGAFSEQQIHYVHAVLLQELANASTRLPVPMPKCKLIISRHSGPPRQLEQLKGVHATLGVSALVSDTLQFQYREASTALDWTSPAAVSGSAKVLEGNCILLQQPDGATPDIEGLMQLRRTRETCNARVIVLCPALMPDAKYSGVANDLFVVTPCDPNPGFDEAFVLTCPELSNPINPMIGKVLCCLRLGDNGLETEITPYVSDDLKTRLMAILKGQQWSLEKIGKLVGINKSNVSRKLRNLPAIPMPRWNQSVLEEWLVACRLDHDDDDEPDDDYEDDEVEISQWDDDDSSAPEPVAPARRNERNTRNDGTKPKRKPR